MDIINDTTYSYNINIAINYKKNECVKQTKLEICFLLLNFLTNTIYNIDRSIKIDGKDIHNVKLKSLRSAISEVP